MSNNIVNRVKAYQASSNLPANQEVTQHADGSGGPISINKQTNENEYKAENKGKKKEYSLANKIGHGALTLAGLFPVFGNAADVANAAWYGAEGRGWEAAGAAAAAIPGSQLFTGLNLARKGFTAAGKYAAKADKIKKGLSGRTGHDLVNASIKARQLNNKAGESGINAVRGGFGHVYRGIRGNQTTMQGLGGALAEEIVTDAKVDDDGKRFGGISSIATGINDAYNWYRDDAPPNTPKKQRYTDGVSSSNRQHIKTYTK